MANTLAFQPLVEVDVRTSARPEADLQIITTPVVEPLAAAPTKLFTHPFRLLATIVIFYAMVALAIWQGIALIS